MRRAARMGSRAIEQCEQSIRRGPDVANRESLRYRPAMTKITVLDNGPLRIEGTFTICDASGKEFGLGGRTALSLCRCGKSANLPFCDGAHARTGFQSACPARDLPPPKPKV